LPAYANGQAPFDSLYGKNKQSAYARYLDRYLAPFDGSVAAPLLCADHYPFLTAASRRDFASIPAHARGRRAPQSTAALIPMWLVVQLRPSACCPPFASAPSDAQVRWQARGAQPTA
jgi:hypothetical protein